MAGNGIVDKYMKIVDKVISYIPYKRFSAWKSFFLNPLAVLSKSRLSIKERMKDLYVMAGVQFLISFVAMILPLGIFSVISIGLPMLLLSFILIVLSLIISPIVALIYAFIEYVVAKALGGTAVFSSHFNASALPILSVFTVLLPLAIIDIPFQWISYIPIISCIAFLIRFPISIAGTLAGLYSLYLKYISFKSVHKLSKWRAAGVVVLPIIIIFVVLLIILAVLFTFFGGITALLAGLGGSSVLPLQH